MATRMMIFIAAGLAACASPALAQPTCLTTSFASNNAFAGNMFDIEVKRNIDLTRWQVNTSGTDMVTIEIYWREGSFRGYENDPSAWTLLGSATTQGQGTDYPTSVNVGNLPAYEGRVYGFYVHLASYQIGVQSLRWVRGEPTVFENDDLKLTTGVGLGFPAFFGRIYENNWWSGTVCYAEPKPLIAVEGDCPGRMTFYWDRSLPQRHAGLLYARNLGRFTIPAIQCGGTELGLGSQQLQLIRAFNTGPEGRGRFASPVTAPYCGGYLQMIVVDRSPCPLSNIVQLPQ